MKKLKFSLIEELELENCKRSLNFIKIMVFQKMLTLAMVYLCIASFFFLVHNHSNKIPFLELALIMVGFLFWKYWNVKFFFLNNGGQQKNVQFIGRVKGCGSFDCTWFIWFDVILGSEKRRVGWIEACPCYSTEGNINPTWAHIRENWARLVYSTWPLPTRVSWGIVRITGLNLEKFCHRIVCLFWFLSDGCNSELGLRCSLWFGTSIHVTLWFLMQLYTHFSQKKKSWKVFLWQMILFTSNFAFVKVKETVFDIWKRSCQPNLSQVH